MALTPEQQKKFFELLNRINNAIEAGEFAEPFKKLSELNEKYPRQFTVLKLMGKANAKRGRHVESISYYKQSVDCNKEDASTRFEYALALQKGGLFDESLIECERALYRDPKHFHLLRLKCSILTDLDRVDAAYKAWKQLGKLTKDEEYTSSHRLAIAVSYSRLAPKITDPQEAIDELNKYVVDKTATEELRIAAYWQIGRLCEHLEKYDNAFEAYKSFKTVKKAVWNPDVYTKRVDKLIDCWTNNSDIPYSTIDGSRLIFIVGMMRSGTSLTEQMICQNETITPGGESNAINRQTMPLDRLRVQFQPPFANNRELLTEPTIQKMAKDAMLMYSQRVAQTGLLTDKLPHNYANVPLIAHMFPGCKIVHCMRDPLDCLLSNYTQAFARPHMQTHDLYWLGRYYRDYERMMEAWRTLDEVDMVDLQYEKLVADPETESKRIFAFLGLDWSEDILGFHNSKRIVNTASRDQVRKPMYTSSVQKYKKYEHHLDELKRGLGMQG